VKQFIIVGLAGATALASLAGIGLADRLTTDVTLSVSGEPTVVRTSAKETVAQVLAAKQIALGAHDAVQPALSTVVTDNMSITVSYAHLVDVTIDGVPRSLWTTSPTVGDVVAALGVTDPAARVTPDRSTPINPEGIDIAVIPPKLVTLRADGATTTFQTMAPTVADLLSARGITLGAEDRLTPAATTAVTDGTSVVVQRVATTQETTTQAIPFDKTKKNDSKLDKGTTKVKTAGVDGAKEQTWQVVTVDGAEESRTLLSETVTSAPVTEVTLVGTKKVATTTPAATPATTGSSSSGSASAPASGTGGSGSPAPTGSAQEIAKGLLGDFGFGDDQFGCLVNLWNRESRWNVSATNRYSGAYGIPQALPGSKMAKFGADWRTNPVTQIKWGLSYIKGRYGTPCGAWSHFLSHNWY